MPQSCRPHPQQQSRLIQPLLLPKIPPHPRQMTHHHHQQQQGQTHIQATATNRTSTAAAAAAAAAAAPAPAATAATATAAGSSTAATPCTIPAVRSPRRHGFDGDEDAFGLSLARMTTDEFKAFLDAKAESEHVALKKLRRRFRGRTYASNARLRRIARHRDTATKAQQAAQCAYQLNAELQHLRAEVARLRDSDKQLRNALAAAGVALPRGLR
eukprot:m.80364 g.80364  ORF g.80364 m.80364 type:complete len:214 (-) comp14660_c2_seq1:32-673(-)